MACHAVDEVYVETLTITELGHNSVRLEIGGSLGVAGREAQAVDSTNQAASSAPGPHHAARIGYRRSPTRSGRV